MKTLIPNCLKLLILVLFTSCNSDDNTAVGCDENVLISSTQFDSALSDLVTVNSITISGDCLVANISASGCDGETWILRLIDSDVVLDTSPPQRTLRLVLANNEACLAFVTREISFDINDLKVDEGSVLLHIVNLNEAFLYSY